MKTVKQASTLRKATKTAAALELAYLPTPAPVPEAEVLSYLRRIDKQQKKILALLTDAHIVSVPEAKQLRRTFRFNFLKGSK